jgi:hypothetical protein
MSEQGTDTSFVKQPRRRPAQEDFEGTGQKKKREKKAGPNEAEQFLESLEPETEKIQHYNERFDSIEQSVESYKTSFAEYLGQLESDSNSLELKKDFYAKALRLIDGLNNTEAALSDLKNKQLSEVEGQVHVLAMGGIPPKAMGDYDRINLELDGLRDKIQAKVEEVEQLKKDDHDTLVKKGHEQGATDANGIVGQAQAERAKEAAQRFFDETVNRFKEAVKEVRTIKPEEFVGDSVAFEPPTSWKQIVGEKQTHDKELLAHLEAMSAEGIFDQLYSDLQVAVEQKNEELNALRAGDAADDQEAVPAASVFDEAEEEELEQAIDSAGEAVIGQAEQEDNLKMLGQLRRELKVLEHKINERKNKGTQPKYNREARKKFEREADKLKARIAELEQLTDPGLGSADATAPEASGNEEAAWNEYLQDLLDSGELFDNGREPQLGEQLDEEVERLRQLPPKERAGIIEGLANAGYWLQKTKSNALKSVTGKLTLGMSKERGWGKYITEYSKTYERDAVRAEKMRVQKKGVLTSAAGLGALTGNMLKLGRVAYDFAGGSLRSLNPFRHVTTGALFVARGAEAGKEVRLGNQKVISKNRTLADIDFEAPMTGHERQEAEHAMNDVASEAWALYEKAGVKDIKIAGADGAVDQAKLAEAKQLMDKAYAENLPEDLKKRLGRLNVSGTSLLEKVFLKGDVISSVEAINNKLEKIENNQQYSQQEKASRKQAVLASSERLLKDLDRMIGDQGMVDWLAYAAKKTEWTGKAAANIMLLDTVRIVWQKLPEVAHAISEWKLGTSHALADALPKARVALPPEADAVNKKTIDALDQNPPKGTAPANSAAFGNRSSAAKPLPGAERAPLQQDGHGGGTQERVGGHKGSAPVQEQASSAKRAPAPVQEQASSAKRGPVPVQEQTSSAKRGPVPAAAPAEAPAKPAAAAEAKEFDPKKHFSEEAVVRKGDGVIRVLKRQIVESPKEFGYKGDPDDAAAVKRFAARTAEKVAAENGYWNRETGEEVRLGTKSIGRAAYVLERTNDGKLTVHEFFNEKPGQAMFQKEESHASGSAFEGKNHESYEYLYKGGKGGGFGNLADKAPVGGGQAESLSPELRDLLAQNDREAADLAKDPHGIESEAVKLARARFAELAAAVGKDADGNLLIKETEIAKVINFHDGISADEKTKLDFWKEHLGELKTGNQAKEFFGMAERVYAGKPRVEYNGHLVQAYAQMPGDVKTLPGRAVGYLKVFGKVGYGDTVREGVKEVLGLSHVQELNCKVVLRPDGVVVAEGIKLPGAKHAVDVYISHDKIGMMQPNSFFGMGRWDFWKGDYGVKGGQPMLGLDAKQLRQLTHNIRNIDNLNESNSRHFADASSEDYPGHKQEVKMVPDEPEETAAAKPKAAAPSRIEEPAAANLEENKASAGNTAAAKFAGQPPEAVQPAAKEVRMEDIQRPKLGADRLKALDFIMRSGNATAIAKLSNNDVSQYIEARGIKMGGVEQKNLAVILEKIRNGGSATGPALRDAKALSGIMTIKMRDLASQNETVRTEAAEKIQQLLRGQYQETSYQFREGARKK